MNGTASGLDGRYLTLADVRAVGGEWSGKKAYFVFADGSMGCFGGDGSPKSDRKGSENCALRFISRGQSINWNNIYPADNYKAQEAKKGMKKGKIIIREGGPTPQGREKRLEVRRGKQGRGKVVGAVTYWPWSPVSVATAFETAEDIAWRAGVKLVDSE